MTFDLANYSKFLFGKTTDLGKFPPNNFGLYDMHGNVWEWCEDGWRENYINAPIWPNDSIPWISSNDVYVMRGGSWCSDDKICRSAYRHYSNPYDRCYDYGFRLVVSGVGTL
ncbi:formylglycine-generating enzyme family protein [Anabaena sp. AL93]|uniref:formylglycine-generating enzyme family protein n=1 Tax=Anabaena sp. AL93 TaxID=1678133 RepID=UPI0025BA2C8E|nr:formylglycine-generating enzyme family protein [Anabaena sp. AL93]